MNSAGNNKYSGRLFKIKKVVSLAALVKSK